MKVVLKIKSKAEENEEYKVSYCPYCGSEVSETECEDEFECCVCDTTFYVNEENERVFEVGTAIENNHGKMIFNKKLLENATYEEAYIFARDNSEGTTLILYNTKDDSSELFEDGECLN